MVNLINQVAIPKPVLAMLSAFPPDQINTVGLPTEHLSSSLMLDPHTNPPYPPRHLTFRDPVLRSLVGRLLQDSNRAEPAVLYVFLVESMHRFSLQS